MRNGLQAYKPAAMFFTLLLTVLHVYHNPPPTPTTPLNKPENPTHHIAPSHNHNDSLATLTISVKYLHLHKVLRSI